MPFDSTSSDPQRWSNRRILILLALGTLIVSVVWRLPEALHYIGEHSQELIITMVLAMAFTYLLRPGVNALNRLPMFGRGSHRGRAWATVVMFILAGGLLYVFVAIGLRPVTQDARELTKSFVAQTPKQRQALIARWQTTIERTVAPYREFLPDGGRDLKSVVPKAIRAGSDWAMPRIGGLFKHAGFVVELLLIPVLVFYFLADGPAIRHEFALLLPLGWRPHARKMALDLDRVLDGFIRGQVIMCLIAWVFVSLMLWALKVPHAFTLGLIAGLTRAVPVIGPLLGGVPLVLVCLLTTRSLPITLAVFSGFTIMHFVESKVLLPRVIGHEVDLHPVSVIVALLIGLEFFGFLGVFLAVPVAAVAKILLNEWQHSQQSAAKSALSAASVVVVDTEANAGRTGAREPGVERI